jgi:AICAR transformylase/IMP cyclohydrolase PurH
MFIRKEKYPFKGKSVEIISISGPTIQRFVAQMMINMKRLHPKQYNRILEELKRG